jgi:hypothetical protein
MGGDQNPAAQHPRKADNGARLQLSKKKWVAIVIRAGLPRILVQAGRPPQARRCAISTSVFPYPSV